MKWPAHSITRWAGLLGCLLGLAGCTRDRADHASRPEAAYSDVQNHSGERVRRVESIDDRAVVSETPATPRQARAEEAQARATDLNPANRGTASWITKSSPAAKQPRTAKTPGQAANPFFRPLKTSSPGAPGKVRKKGTAKVVSGPPVRAGGNHPDPAPIRTRGEEAAEKAAQQGNR